MIKLKITEINKLYPNRKHANLTAFFRELAKTDNGIAYTPSRKGKSKLSGVEFLTCNTMEDVQKYVGDIDLIPYNPYIYNSYLLNGEKIIVEIRDGKYKPYYFVENKYHELPILDPKSDMRKLVKFKVGRNIYYFYMDEQDIRIFRELTNTENVIIKKYDIEEDENNA